jgi:hypothetical protein
MKVVAPLKKNEKNLPLLSMTFINSFEGSYGNFREGRKKFIVINDIGSICSQKIEINYFYFSIKKNHGVYVSMTIVILFRHIKNNVILNHNLQIHL